MFKFIRKKFIHKEKEVLSSHREQITLNDLLYVIKYGEEIGLNVENRDRYEDGYVLALGRCLNLTGKEIKVSQWAEWTITITLIDGKQQLVILELKIPNSNIEWNKEDRFVSGDKKLQWKEEGIWCDTISTEILELKQKIIEKRTQEKEKEKLLKSNAELRERDQINKKKEYFNKLHKN